MKTLIVILGLLIISGCGGDTGPAAPTPTDTVVIMGVSPSPSPSVSPSPSPSVSPSPTPTPSPTPSPSPTVTPYGFSGGAGTMADPYILEVALDVAHVSDYPAAYYTVDQDINMASQPFTGLGNFSGTIYGNNYQLYNMTIARTDANPAALFSVMSGTLVNVKLVNVTISGLGFASGFADNLTGLVSHCSISGTITSPSGGNGFNTGIGNPSYHLKTGAGSIVTTTQSVHFNGNLVNNSW